MAQVSMDLGKYDISWTSFIKSLACCNCKCQVRITKASFSVISCVQCAQTPAKATNDDVCFAVSDDERGYFWTLSAKRSGITDVAIQPIWRIFVRRTCRYAKNLSGMVWRSGEFWWKVHNTLSNLVYWFPHVSPCFVDLRRWFQEQNCTGKTRWWGGSWTTGKCRDKLIWQSRLINLPRPNVTSQLELLKW